MVDEEKVRLMTEVALAEQKEKKDTLLATRYYSDDYIGFQVLKSWIGITFLYMFLLVLWALRYIDELTTQYSLSALFRLLARAGILYAVVSIVTIVICMLIYTSHYWKARSNSRGYVNALRKLQKFYQRDDKERRK